MTKILIFNGSPRKRGNTSTLIEECVKAIKKAGSEVEVFSLHNMNIGPCKFCDWCKKTNNLSCIQDDDMKTLYPKLIETDVLIFATPIFWFTVTAQMKLFIDRLYALDGKDGHALTNKKIAAIMVYGDSNAETSGVNNAIAMLEDMRRYLKSENVGIVHGTAYKLGDAAKNEKLMKEAYELGKTVSKG
ncbi:MAG: flavodoxin family protein [Candidatus Heimdallarchaeota archaeon]